MLPPSRPRPKRTAHTGRRAGAAVMPADRAPSIATGSVGALPAVAAVA